MLITRSKFTCPDCAIGVYGHKEGYGSKQYSSQRHHISQDGIALGAQFVWLLVLCIQYFIWYSFSNCTNVTEF